MAAVKEATMWSSPLLESDSSKWVKYIPFLWKSQLHLCNGKMAKSLQHRFNFVTWHTYISCTTAITVAPVKAKSLTVVLFSIALHMAHSSVQKIWIAPKGIRWNEGKKYFFFLFSFFFLNFCSLNNISKLIL